MMTERIYNFNPGPAALPLVVLEEIRDNFLNFKESGMSITEISHRSKEFDDVIFSKAELNKVHGPVKTQFGYHLIEITGRNM